MEQPGLWRRMILGLLSLGVLVLAPVIITLDTAGAGEDKMRQQEKRPVANLYFASPRAAVTEAARLLRAEDWATLAAYYDLSGSNTAWDSLLRGEFFIRTERPAGAHPGGFWRYRQPFSPSFKYLTSTPGKSPDRVEVTVHIRIDQGAGSPAQEGYDRFEMRKSDDGYQFLPRSP